MRAFSLQQSITEFAALWQNQDSLNYMEKIMIPMMQGISTGGSVSSNSQSAVPRTSMEVHQESLVGRSIVQLFHQLNDVETALNTLHDRLSPVLVDASPKPVNNSAGAEIQVQSPMSTDILHLQSKVTSAADKVYDLIHRLSI